jgi:hypothetical protein
MAEEHTNTVSPQDPTVCEPIRSTPPIGSIVFHPATHQTTQAPAGGSMKGEPDTRKHRGHSHH